MTSPISLPGYFRGQKGRIIPSFKFYRIDRLESEKYEENQEADSILPVFRIFISALGVRPALAA